MTFRHLEIFMSVYQNQSITKASKELHISQPSVSFLKIWKMKCMKTM